MELGTKDFPYKSIQYALIELLNYLPQEIKDYQILVKENTTDYISSLFSE